jgi:hypothetical protein
MTPMRTVQSKTALRQRSEATGLTANLPNLEMLKIANTDDEQLGTAISGYLLNFASPVCRQSLVFFDIREKTRQ